MKMCILRRGGLRDVRTQLTKYRQGYDRLDVAQNGEIRNTNTILPRLRKYDDIIKKDLT